MPKSVFNYGFADYGSVLFFFSLNQWMYFFEVVNTRCKLDTYEQGKSEIRDFGQK